MENKKISEIYNIHLKKIKKNNIYQMDEWYFELLNKTYEQINLFDVTRMIIQKCFVDMAVNKAVYYLKENPFIGQRYEGELLELLCKLDKQFYKDINKDLNTIISKARKKNQQYEWLCEEEREEYYNLLNELSISINNIG